MKILVLISVLFFISPAFAVLSAASCKSKINAAYTARTGKTMVDGDFNVLIDICQGIIDELRANGDVKPNTLAVTPSNMNLGGSPISGNGAVTTGLGKID